MKAILSLLILGLSALLYVQWEIAPEQFPEPLRQRKAPPEEGEQSQIQAPTPMEALGDPESFDSISQRPLFVEGRRPPEDEEIDAAPQPAQGLEGVDLSAVLITSKEQAAWVKENQSGELTRLSPGETFRGWTVQEIHPDRLLLARGQETSELELREFQEMAAPPPARPGVRTPGVRPIPPRSVPSRQRRQFQRPPKGSDKDD